MAKKVTKKKTPTAKKTPSKKKTAANESSGAVSVASNTQAITDDLIRKRAFEIYCSGENPSNPDADWHQAERELKAAP